MMTPFTFSTNIPTLPVVVQPDRDSGLARLWWYDRPTPALAEIVFALHRLRFIAVYAQAYTISDLPSKKGAKYAGTGIARHPRTQPPQALFLLSR